ncbi:GlxA family transcriptional regulator [Flavobacterium phycosphaerae]|uniref:GlxA family transcriptional regulator n=1 Tax=Flavobacterium phycosphaerae TaxID=2697515 RepID=UPI00138ADC0D|nr:helix-turn-helix domain-containing protein [Flavobacterium phycosphaerae]
MKRVGLVLTEDYKLLSVAALLEVLETANKLVLEKGQTAPFAIAMYQLPTQLENGEVTFHGYTIQSIAEETGVLDVILLPAFTTNDIPATIGKNLAYIPWLQQQYRSGAEVASFCSGAFLFGASGLLNGKSATTHIDSCAAFARAFPEVKLKPNETVTADDRTFTSGGSTSLFHLIILLVQKYCGHEIAIQVAKLFAIDMDRYQQSYFGTFRPNYTHNDALVSSIQEKIEKRFHQIENLEEVLGDVPASRRNLVRRFKLATGIPPIEYLQNIRIETAKRHLEQSQLSVSEIIDKSGYTDPKSFRKVFQKVVGMKPLEYREKFKVR